MDIEVRMKRIEDIISSRKVFLLFCFYFLLVLFFGKIEKVLQFIRREINMGVARITEETSITREGEKSGCSRLGQQSYFDFNYTPEARLTSDGEGGKGE